MPDNAPAPGSNNDALAAIAAQIAASGGAGTGGQPKVGNAIGVPTYVIDPDTGQAVPATNPDGSPRKDKAGNPVYQSWQTQGLALQPSFNPGIGGVSTATYQDAIVGARYFEGDEWAQIGGLSPELKAQIQDAMLDRGLYSSAKPRIARGAWDNDSATAFKQVLAYANAQGIPWNLALDNMPKMDDAGKVKYGPQAPHVYTPFTATLTNPTDLKAVIKAGARSVLGRTLSDDEVGGFIGNYQSAEMANQQAQYAAQHQNETARFAAQDAYARAQDEFQQTGTATTPVPSNVETAGGVFTNPASPSNAAEETARSLHPGEAGAHDIARTFDQFVGLLGGILGNTQTAGTPGGQ